MFNWFNTHPCNENEHEWLYFGFTRQCRKCFLIRFGDTSIECPVCDGSGKVYTRNQVTFLMLSPWSFWFDPPIPKACPKCNGSGRVEEDKVVEGENES